mgnify:CR=1 FL=1
MSDKKKQLFTDDEIGQVVQVATELLGDLLTEKPINEVRILFAPRLFNSLSEIKK